MFQLIPYSFLQQALPYLDLLYSSAGTFMGLGLFRLLRVAACRLDDDRVLRDFLVDMKTRAASMAIRVSRVDATDR